MRTLGFVAVLALVPASALARNVEAGEIWVGGGTGLSLKMGSELGGSSGHWALRGHGEYVVSKELSAVGSLNLGISGTIPLRLRGGARYRLTDLGLPISPYGQAELSVGKLYDVIGANLTTLGLFLGAGADYFFTAKLMVGGLIGIDLSRTFVDDPGRSAFFGTFEILATASYRL